MRAEVSNTFPISRTLDIERSDGDVLVAGYGTGQHLIGAVQLFLFDRWMVLHALEGEQAGCVRNSIQMRKNSKHFAY